MSASAGRRVERLAVDVEKSVDPDDRRARLPRAWSRRQRHVGRDEARVDEVLDLDPARGLLVRVNYDTLVAGGNRPRREQRVDQPLGTGGDRCLVPRRV